MCERLVSAKSGVEIYEYRNPSQNGFYLSLYMRVGSMYELDSESGITHFLEHAAIRNVNAIMDGALYRVLDEYGLEFNASTYTEMVQFYLSGATENFKLGADIITKILEPIILAPNEIKTEAQRIKAEIRENDDNSSLATFTNKIVHAGTALSRSITGKAGDISRMTRSKLEDYRIRTMTPENIFFYVTGNFSDEDLEYLKSLVDTAVLEHSTPNENIAPVPEKFGHRDGKVEIKHGDFTMLRFTFDIDMSRVSMQETDLIYDILLSGYNSRFFVEMSERRGLFYDLTGATERYKNIGTLTFSYEVKPDMACEAAKITFAVLDSMRREPIDDRDMMKAGYVSNSKMLYDDYREMNFTLAYDNHVMSNGYRTLKERAEAYDKVTPDDILRASREIFRAKNLTLTVKGNKKKIDVKSLESLIAEFG